MPPKTENTAQLKLRLEKQDLILTGLKMALSAKIKIEDTKRQILLILGSKIHANSDKKRGYMPNL